MRLHKLSVPGIVFVLLFLIEPDIQSSELYDTIKIGLLIPDKKSLAAKQGAELALLKANENGGYKGKPFRMIVRTMEGPWGTGSKEAVNLIFDEKVTAILGSHDGRNAHLVEQVAAKERIIFMSAWSGDPSLSQAFVPWFFSCVPNNNQQATAFIEEVYNKRNIRKVAVVSDNGYDSKLALNCFVNKCIIAGKPQPLKFFYDTPNPDFNDLSAQINNADVNCIILFGQSTASIKLMQSFQQKKMNRLFICSLSVIDEEEISSPKLNNFENVLIVSPGYFFTQKGQNFRQDFLIAYGYLPDAVAAYAYDGMNLIIEAIRKAGTERGMIQKTLAGIKHEGVTGTIQFDDKGNRTGSVELMEIKNGIPVRLVRLTPH